MAKRLGEPARETSLSGLFGYGDHSDLYSSISDTIELNYYDVVGVFSNPEKKVVVNDGESKVQIGERKEYWTKNGMSQWASGFKRQELYGILSRKTKAELYNPLVPKGAKKSVLLEGWKNATMDEIAEKLESINPSFKMVPEFANINLVSFGNASIETNDAGRWLSILLKRYDAKNRGSGNANDVATFEERDGSLHFLMSRADYWDTGANQSQNQHYASRYLKSIKIELDSNADFESWIMYVSFYKNQSPGERRGVDRKVNRKKEPIRQSSDKRELKNESKIMRRQMTIDEEIDASNAIEEEKKLLRGNWVKKK